MPEAKPADIEALELSVRTYNCLKIARIETVAEARGIVLLGLRGFQELTVALRKHGNRERERERAAAPGK